MSTTCVGIALLACLLASCNQSDLYDYRATPETNRTREEVLMGADELYCAGPVGVTAEWDVSLEPKFSKPARMSAEYPPIVFKSIDTASRTAKFVGNQSLEEVTVFTTPGSLHFIEETLTGSLNLTTVFSVGLQTMGPREFFFVHSRHVVGFGMPPIVSQFIGKCLAVSH